MDDWTLATIALVVLGYAAFSRAFDRAELTPAIAFTAAGLVAGEWLGLIEVDGGQIKLLAEITLALVLFSDASRISVGALRREAAIPARLLGIGLPLTIVAGALAALGVLPALTLVEAVVLATMLACTDAALGQAVVSDERVPSRIRQGLNVESGLNDGLCVPIFLIALAVAEAEETPVTAGSAARIVLEEIGFGAVGGVVAGLLGVVALRAGIRHGLVERGWTQILTVAAALLAAGVADALGGSIFIAAFVAGFLFGWLRRGAGGEVSDLVEEGGWILNAVTFVVFGAAILGPILGELTWRHGVYAVLSLTVVRMLPVAIALVGSGARPQTVAFVGWFGPRGLASIVFGVLLIEEASLPGERTMLLATVATIALSVVAHGLSAGPLTARYGRWYASHPRVGASMESVAVTPPPARWARGARVGDERR
jgi:NhaP-type Na+/H+ or K+/H+ antiporter